ncbi:SCO2322 family protein [Streptomyces sp. Z26]|uniref:SCO2322 family protein n=1 Tax=Streptomyces sp. Z26 TaxID=2500177 RepID=UPI001F0C49B9|nr:SCO2322 family protein [Streptomyces sp. Z26]
MKRLTGPRPRRTRRRRRTTTRTAPGGIGSCSAGAGSSRRARPWRRWRCTRRSPRSRRVRSTRAARAGYRYWSGARRRRLVVRLAGPVDDVLGFRFGVSEDSATKPRARRTSPRLREERRSGSARVALVVDFGTAADAPSGERPPAPRTACARVDAGSGTAADALAAEAEPLRYNSDALLCAIAGYPESGCGERTAADGGTAESDDGDGGDEGGVPPSLGAAAGVGAVLALGAAAYRRTRRRRRG